MAGQKNEIVRTALILLVITFCVALVLSGVNLMTKDRIAQMDAQEKAAAMKAVMPEAEKLEEFKGSLPQGVESAYIAKDKAGEKIGVCLNVAPTGFSGPISMVVGVDNSGAVTAVKIVSMSETPGLGTKAQEPPFIDQFSGKSGELNLVKGTAKEPSDIAAISGATISSAAVTSGVNTALSAAAAIK